MPVHQYSISYSNLNKRHDVIHKQYVHGRQFHGCPIHVGVINGFRLKREKKEHHLWIYVYVSKFQLSALQTLKRTQWILNTLTFGRLMSNSAKQTNSKALEANESTLPSFDFDDPKPLVPNPPPDVSSAHASPGYSFDGTNKRATSA